MPPPPEFSIITRLLIAKHFIVRVAVIDSLYGKLKLSFRGKESQDAVGGKHKHWDVDEY